MTTQTSLNIGTIGQKLESARQTKGVSVSEAGRATKILSKFIEAMENDDFGALSAPVYAKSFIKMYAKYLGLDAAPLVEEYVAKHASQSSPQLSDEVRQNISKVDAVTLDANGNLVPPTERGKAILNDIGATLSGFVSQLTPKMLMIAAGVVLVLIICLAGVTQCAGDESDEPAAAGGAARVERQELTTQPDVYLVKPGVREVEKR